MLRLWHAYRRRRLIRKTVQAAHNYLGGLEAYAAECERKRSV